MEIIKKIQTDHDYGREARILWIYNQTISDDFPSLFTKFWDVFEVWYDHQDALREELSYFLFDAKLPPAEQLWKCERFGNYIYGAFMSVYFSWESLQATKVKRNIRDIQSDLAFIRQVSGFVQHLFTTLDAIACCIYIAEDKIPSGFRQADAELHKLSIKTVGRKINAGAIYRSLGSLLNGSDFKYLSEYRNLLAHRPFYQFQRDSAGLYYFPEDLDQLDSTTQPKKQYFQSDVGAYLTSAFEIIVADLEALLLELGARYRKRI